VLQDGKITFLNLGKIQKAWIKIRLGEAGAHL